jgi:hypothetical protein
MVLTINFNVLNFSVGAEYLVDLHLVVLVIA